MLRETTIAVGFTVAGINSLNQLRPAKSVIVIEDPGIVKQRKIHDLVKDYPVVDQVIAYPHTDADAADALYRMLSQENIASVVPLNEYGTICASRLGECFGVPSAGHAASLILRDKHKLRQESAKHGIANPASACVSDLESAQRFARSFDGPLILKPLDRQGSVGTVIVRDHGDLATAWDRSQNRDEGLFAPEAAFLPVTLIEEFVEGDEFSVEALFKDGKCLFSNVTAKELFGGDRPVESAHVVPAPIAPELAERLVTQTCAMLSGIGFQSGIVHCEWLVRRNEPYLVECAGRFAGDGIIDLICRAYDFDIVDAYHRLMRGDDLPNFPQTAHQTAMVRFLGGEGGIIRSIEKDVSALSKPGIAACDVTAKPGDTAEPPNCSWDRLGAVTTVAPTADAADALARHALAAITINYNTEPDYADAV